jgi:hypothetical protein
LGEVGPGLLRQLRLEHLPGWESLPPRVTSIVGTEEQRRRYEADGAALVRVQLALLREIFGNPFRRGSFDPGWRRPTVATLARELYEAQRFDRMPVLADALQDAGCEDADLLAHCREPGAHVRGCWVLDLVLGWE